MRRSPILFAVLFGVGLSLATAAQAEKRSGNSTATTPTAPTSEKRSVEDDGEGEGEDAKKHPKIKRGKIKQFHGLNDEAGGIVETVWDLHDQVKEVKVNLKTAAGITKDRPIKEAFNNMKTLSGGNLSVEQDADGSPKVTATGDSPVEQVLNFVVAVNNGAKACMSIGETAKAFPGQVQGLVTEVQALPAQLTPAMLSSNGLVLTDMERQLNVINHNVEVLQKTQNAAADIISDTTQILSLVRDLAPSR